MKRTILCVISVIMLIAALSTLLWFNSTYLILNGQIYSRNSASLVITEPELPDMQTLSSFPDLDLLDIRYVNSAMLGQFVEFGNQDVLFLYSTMLLNNSLAFK